jgi:excinuclease ABC subunit A
VRQKKGTYQQLLKDLNKEGYARVRVNGKIIRTDEEISLDRYKKQDIEIVIDRLESSERSRLAEAVENALKKSEGLVLVAGGDGMESTYSSLMACPVCGMAFEELQPRMFSFNSPFGACEECHGLGVRMEFDPDLIIPDKERCIADGAIAPYRNAIDGFRGQYLATLARNYGFSALTPIKDLTKEQYEALMFGSDKRMKFSMSMKGGDAQWSHTGEWEGLLQTAARTPRPRRSGGNAELGLHASLDRPACTGSGSRTRCSRSDREPIIDVTDLSIGKYRVLQR